MTIQVRGLVGTVRIAPGAIAHLSDDEAVAKMGHPIAVDGLDVGHPIPAVY